MKKFVTIIITIFIAINIYAYENNVFKIDIPENYTEVQFDNNIYKWENDNKYIAITISDNVSLKYDVKKYTEEDLQKQREYIETGINNGLEELNITASVTDIKLLNDDNIYYLEYDVYYPSENEAGHDTYQRGRMYTTSKYITTIIYNSDTKVDEDEDYINIINSFKIFDSEIREISMKYYIYTVIIIAVILGITIGSIQALKKRK